MWEVTFFNQGVFVEVFPASDIQSLVYALQAAGINQWDVIKIERMAERR